MRITVLLTLLYLVYTDAKAQVIEKSISDTVYWQEGAKLKWIDFQSKNNPLNKDGKSHSDNTAYCNPSLSVTPIVDANGRDNFLVRAYLTRSTTWVNDSTSMIALSILAHEQLHFDICELIARRIREKIARVYKMGGEMYSRDLYKEISLLLVESHALQNSYDNETDHGNIPIHQKKWRERIKLELARLKIYKSIFATYQ